MAEPLIIRRGDVWDLLTNNGILRRIVKSVACGRVSYQDADGDFMQCDISGFRRWAKSAWLTAADDWSGRDTERYMGKKSVVLKEVSNG